IWAACLGGQCSVGVCRGERNRRAQRGVGDLSGGGARCVHTHRPQNRERTVQQLNGVGAAVARNNPTAQLSDGGVGGSDKFEANRDRKSVVQGATRESGSRGW